jgi:hypothetical protein
MIHARIHGHDKRLTDTFLKHIKLSQWCPIRSPEMQLYQRIARDRANNMRNGLKGCGLANRHSRIGAAGREN